MQVGESYTLSIDGLSISVTCKRVKNVNFRIGPEGQPLMSVPPHITRERAEEIAMQHIGWFQDHMEAMRSRSERSSGNLQSGQHISLWGKQHILRVVYTDKPPSCEQKDDELVLHLPTGATEQYCKALIEEYYACELTKRLKALLPECERRIGVHATHITVRRMKTRWGSCTRSTARIRINTALAECPPACTEMVLVHELCHLIEANHGPRFKALMDLHCPDWRVTKRWLDDHPPRASV